MKKATLLICGCDSRVGKVASQALRDVNCEIINVGHSCGNGDPILMAKNLVHDGKLITQSNHENQEPWYVQHDKKKRKKK